MNAHQVTAYAALGDPTRLAIFERIGERPRSVGELAELVPVSRPAVSQHLKVLKDAGLVVDHAAGTRRIYAIDPTGVEALREHLDRFWNRSLAAFKTAAERPAVRPSSSQRTRSNVATQPTAEEEA